ncbi:MAG: DNA ligase [Thermoanaerobaculia bacterium]|nr:DNA ligase [Thermoanaerobaculia bacterium]
MPDIDDGATVEVQGSAAKPYVLANKGGVYSCSCPAWRNQSVGIEKRTCKHLKSYRGAAAEEARVGNAAPAPKPVPKAAPAPAGDGIAPEETDETKGPPLLLAHSWEGDIDLTGWWMSEKLDGVRAYWDGKQFLSRLGNPYLAPDWFIEGLPDVPLDGELWSGRKKFQRTISIVRRQDRGKDWKEVSFVVFDAPSLKAPFEERLAFCRAHMESAKPPHTVAHDHQLCTGIEHIRKELARVESLGGEGLMMRKPGSPYEAGRSMTLLKIKSFHDAEARVVEHTPGAGKHKGRLGALVVELPSGLRFSVGTGLSDAERKNPPPIGSLITFRYQELSEGGVPRFPSFVCVRQDVAWPIQTSVAPVPAAGPEVQPVSALSAAAAQSSGAAPSAGAPPASAPAKALAPAPSVAAAVKKPAVVPKSPAVSAATPGSTWRYGDPAAPAYPSDFEIVAKAVLQLTDLVSNHNKYYAIEIHQAAGGHYRVFTHYGRTDDLEANPEAGARECRFFDSLAEAQGAYQSIYGQKTRKGYREVSLASSKIGSQKARGASSGDVDEKTLAKISRGPEPREKAVLEPPLQPPATVSLPPPPPPAAPETGPTIKGKLLSFVKRLTGHAPAAEPPAITSLSTPPVEELPIQNRPAGALHPKVHALVNYIYSEATTALTTTVAAQITANGIETPLGVLTIGQIEKGEALLQELYEVFKKKSASRAEMVRLSGEFYTVIPHRIGRSRSAIEEAVIDSMEAFEQKQETLQLMKDMLAVNGEAGDVLFKSETEKQYEALRCDLGWVDPASDEGRAITDYVLKSQVKSHRIKVQNIYSVRRGVEWTQFAEGIGNNRLLFHGSRIKNWVGILSRGILLPKIVVSMGVHRTDAGWLGNGIYFGDAACTSSFYTSPGRKKTRLMAIARVALGRVKDFTKITYGLNAPPAGYDSCHGVRAHGLVVSDFADDEYVVYKAQQQRLETLVEFTS